MLIYDGDCGFCRRSLGWARRLGATCDARPAHAVDLAAYGLTPADALEAAWYVAPDGRLYRGHLAIAQVLRSARHAPVRGVGVLVGARALAPVASRVYDWVADHRHRLPGGEACAVDEPDEPGVSGRARRRASGGNVPPRAAP